MASTYFTWQVERSMADGNKSEQATPRQRQKARERGQVTRSRELSGALSMCAVAGAMYLMCQRSGAAVGAFLPHNAGSRQCRLN